MSEKETVTKTPIYYLDQTGSVIQLQKENKRLDRLARTLWNLLDDIDTASDTFKDDYKGLASHVYRKQQERWKVSSSDGYKVEWNFEAIDNAM